MIKFDTSLYYFDEQAANTFVKIIETNLVHPKGPLAGKPFILEDWQKEDFIYPFFGIKRLSDKKRKYTTLYMEVPKKNGKTPLMAAVLMVCLAFIEDSGAELSSLASSRDQAKLIYNDAKKMVRAGSAFASRFKFYQNAIMVDNKTYKPLSADVGTNDGGNNNLVIFDEVHRYKDRELMDLMYSSTAAKLDPIIIMITTAGSDFNSICWEKHEYAVNVKKGIINDPDFLPVIYAADKDDDPFLEATWKKANPNYGISVTKQFMEKMALQAKTNAAYLNTFLRLHLNIWTNVETVWITDDKYLKCTEKLDINKLEFEECYAGLDLSSVSDITAFTLVFPPSYRDYHGDKYLSFSWYWLPEEKGANSADKNNNNYAGWLRDGFIEETNGNVIDYDYIKPQIEGICSRFKVVNMAFDPYNSHQIAAKLSETFTMTQFRQGFVSMNFPTKQLEIKINREEILFDNNPVTRWMMSNAVLLTNKEGNLVKIDKNQPHQKIDGVITNIMALGLCTTEVEKTGSYLDSEDLIVL